VELLATAAAAPKTTLATVEYNHELMEVRSLFLFSSLPMKEEEGG